MQQVHRRERNRQNAQSERMCDPKRAEPGVLVHVRGLRAPLWIVAHLKICTTRARFVARSCRFQLSSGAQAQTFGVKSNTVGRRRDRKGASSEGTGRAPSISKVFHKAKGVWIHVYPVRVRVMGGVSGGYSS